MSLSSRRSRIDGPALRGAVLPWPINWPRALAFAIALGTAALVVLPLLSLARIAAIGDADIWPHLFAHVLPVALAQTVLLLLGVAAVATVAGAGTAWLVTTFQFPGRGLLLWLDRNTRLNSSHYALSRMPSSA